MQTAFKQGIKWLAKELFGELFTNILSSYMSDLILSIFGFIMLGSIAILVILERIKHYRTPKCKHKRRGLCYECDPIEII